MKNLSVTLAILTIFFAGNVFANHEGHSHDDAANAADSAALQKAADAAQCADKINVKVNGLVCDFCARALEKVFGKRDDVAGIKVDLDSGNVTVATKSGQKIDDDTLTKLITDSGYNVVKIERGC